MDERRPLLVVAFQTHHQANGGIESLTQLLLSLGRRVIVVTQRESKTTERWRAAGFDVRVWSAGDGAAVHGKVGRALSRARRAPETALWNAKIAGLVRSTGARVVHCNDMPSLLSAAVGARQAGARVVFNVRGIPERTGGTWSLARHLADRIVALSNEMVSALEAKMPPLVPLGGAPIEAVYSAVSEATFQGDKESARRALGIGQGALALAQVAVVRELKCQLPFLQDVAPRLLAAHPKLHLYFVGDCAPSDPYAAECLAAGQALERVHGARIHFVGFTDRPELYYQACDAIFIGSRTEGLARAMIESLACGTPVVSFDVTSAREILEPVRCGLVAKMGDFEVFAEHLDALLKSPELRAEMGLRASGRARALFHPDVSARAYEALYRSLEAKASRDRAP